MRQLQWQAMAVALAAVLVAFVLLLMMPSAARGALAPLSPSPPLSVSNFVIVDPTGNVTAHSGPVMLAQGSGQHQFVFDTVGYRIGISNFSRILAPGQYSTAVDTWLGMTNDPACQGGSTTGWAQVDQATYDQAGDVMSAAMQFEFFCFTGTHVYGSIAYQLTNSDPVHGYYLFGPRVVSGFGNSSYLSYLGTPGTLNLPTAAVGMVVTPDGFGYLMAGADGGVFAFGDAQFQGSLGGTHLNAPDVGMAATPDGLGYWLVAADGGVFAFGDARFAGSMGGSRLNRPVIGIAGTPDGHGYWLVASDGGIFSFGDAHFFGSTGGQRLNAPIVGMAGSEAAQGYWLVAADGGVFAYGAARFQGSMGGRILGAPVVGIASSPSGAGYWLVASDGGVFSFGDATFQGSGVSAIRPLTAVGIAAG